jgi:threonine dehydratase
VQRLVHSVETVSDDEVKHAVRYMLLRQKILVEPTGAVPIALLLSGRLPIAASRVGVIVSGGNADPAVIAELLQAPDRD